MCRGLHGNRNWHSTAAASLCALAIEDDPLDAIHSLVDCLLAQADADALCPPLELLWSFRRVRRVEAREMVEDGRLVPEGDGYVIQVNCRHSEEKQRFTIGHETCHTFFS